MRKNSRNRLLFSLILFASGAVVWEVYGNTITNTLVGAKQKTHEVAQDLAKTLE